MARKREASSSFRDSPQKAAKSEENGSTLRRSTRGSQSTQKVKEEVSDDTEYMHGVPIAKIKKEEDDATSVPPATPAKKQRANGVRDGRVKSENGEGESLAGKTLDDDEKPPPTPKSLNATTPSNSTLAKKLKQLEQYLQTPFPDYPYPTAEQCQSVQDSLAKVHGLPRRPDKLVDKEGAPAGCGAVPDVLDALVRTILSQNTTSANSTRAKNAMDAKYGRANYAAVHKAPVEDLAETIACGGLANIKAKVIKKVIAHIVAKQMDNDPLLKEGDIKTVSLDYLHEMSDLDAMRELVSFDGVGPKTASCVLLFCLQRNSFAVDTHVFRITKALGWTPSKANRETAFQHLDVRIPDENKYPLHALLVKHGRSCRSCSANGNITDPEVDSSQCPIKMYLKDARSAASSRGKKGKMEDAEETAGMLPKDIKDEEADP